MNTNQGCENCPVHNIGNLKKLGINMDQYDHVIALAGNPNTGKSTVFNNLTGLRQHTGNWPGKTVTRAEGGFEYNSKKFKKTFLSRQSTNCADTDSFFFIYIYIYIIKLD